MFKINYNSKRKREKPNSLKDKPTISFRSDLQPAVLGHLKKLREKNLRSQWINNAIEMKFLREKNKREYYTQILTADFKFCRFLLRGIGKKIAEK